MGSRLIAAHQGSKDCKHQSTARARCWQVEGQITQIFVHSGDRVAEGSALMEILCSLVLLLRPIQLRLLCRAGALLAQLSNFLILVLDPTSVRTRRRPDSELLAIR